MTARFASADGPERERIGELPPPPYTEYEGERNAEGQAEGRGFARYGNGETSTRASGGATSAKARAAARLPLARCAVHSRAVTTLTLALTSRVRAVTSVWSVWPGGFAGVRARACSARWCYHLQPLLHLTTCTETEYFRNIYYIIYTCIGGKNIRYSIIIGTVSLPAIETGHPETFKPARRERGDTSGAKRRPPEKEGPSPWPPGRRPPIGFDGYIR